MQINNNVDNDFQFYLGTSDNQGNVNMIYDPDVFNEDTNTFKDPITGQTYTATSWEYYYNPSCRGYVLNFSGSTYQYNSTPVQHIYLLYANDALYILGYDDAGLQDAQDTGLYSTYSIFSRKFDYVIAEKRNTTVSPTTCEHVWTSETITAPTCTTEGLRRFTCTICSTTHDEWIPATGHNYEYQGHTEAVYSQGGDIISPGYSTYECSVCEDTYVVYDTNTGPTQPVNPGGDDPGSGSGSGSGDDSGSGSIWEKIGQLIGGIVEGITNFVSAVLGAFLDALINLGSIIHERASALLEMILEWFELIPELFGGFLAFMTALFPFLPDEIIMLLEFGLAAAIVVGLIKLVRK